MTKALRIPVEGPIEVVNITGLAEYQKQVGGYIEYAALLDDNNEDEKWEQTGQTLVINEEGKLGGYELNPIASILFGSFVHGDPIMGDVVVVGGPDKTGEDTDVDLVVVLRVLARRLRERMVG